MTQEAIFKAIREREMKVLNIQVTSSCNYACGMCPFHGDGYSGEYFDERPTIRRDMSLDEIKLILEKASMEGFEWIDLTPNGEFFTHKQWYQILSLIKEFGLKIMITSNGGLLGEEDIKRACEVGVDHIVISVDSLSYESYKKIRKPATKLAFERAIHAPLYFKKYGGDSIYVQIQITEQPEFPHEALGVLDFYKDKGLNQISLKKMFVTGEDGIGHIGVEKLEYTHGKCKAYGSPIVMTDGTVLPCCGAFYFYPKLGEKIPNIFNHTIFESARILDDLYERDSLFGSYCRNCSLYDSSRKAAPVKFIFGDYYAEQTLFETRYFILPKYLRFLPSLAILWLYKKGYARKIKQWLVAAQ
ncbi:radical SAM/SPASM domain-containing protein [Wolinella succinogenes]|uniref:Radical SAM core domain-containing protein n=1 Tax=Wolinella succinogenes (strain ATCC 29543 / DSM 1740 / CCUG 13145 / JCM 31913 / LMG 7466 / NCTC 11488 / FDC 602W) TaxID=273121 RepID=Q7MQM0_WOLSU|nr:radical SAM protein [Wolinella succinogenes]NLU33527.1 radical SAM protein [Wolinella succinogenes]CAE11184.1 hypothetical protein WS2193 [Wolinella succinogenes]VEG81350.1 molybdenum cofactor biosynthesis protein A [Wolinella succinogenes]HCZ17972.1 radical SAM protein [Helicobacter sp.]